MKYILSLILAFTLVSCDFKQRNQITFDTVSQACDGKNILLGDDITSKEEFAAEVICNLAKGFTSPTALPPIQQCVAIADTRKTEEFKNDYDQICSQIIDPETETALRAATVAFTALNSIDPKFNPPTVTFNKKKI